MANKKDQYLTRIEKSPGRVKRLQREGWEVTAVDRSITWGNSFHLRKPNPDYVSREERQAQQRSQATNALKSSIPADASFKESIWYGELDGLQKKLTKAEQKVRAAQWAIENRPKKNSAEKLTKADDEAEKLRGQIVELEAKIKGSETSRAAKREEKREKRETAREERRARKGILPDDE